MKMSNIVIIKKILDNPLQLIGNVPRQVHFRSTDGTVLTSGISHKYIAYRTNAYFVLPNITNVATQLVTFFVDLAA
jgi:hypothetical protein